MLMATTWFLSKLKSFSYAALSSAFCSSSLPTHAAPKATASTTSRRPSTPRIDRVVCFMASTGLARLPHREAYEEQAERQDVEGEEGQVVLLFGGHVELVREPLLGPDGDVRFLSCHPGHRVERHVSIAENAQVGVGGEERVAEHHQARLGGSGAVVNGDGERHRTCDVDAGVELDALSTLDGGLVHFPPGATPRPGDLDDIPTNGDLRKPRHAAGERVDARHCLRGGARSGDGVAAELLRDGDLRVLRIRIDDGVLREVDTPAVQHRREACVG